jgi:hypothetical protein
MDLVRQDESGQAGLSLPQRFFPFWFARSRRARARLLWILCIAALAFASGAECSAQANGRSGQGRPLQQPLSQNPSRQNNAQQTNAQKVGIEISQQLFDTMCALWAAGFNSDVNLASLPPAWSRVAEQMSKQQGPATDALRQYYTQQDHNNREATRSRYVSFAMVAGPPPDFGYTLRNDDLPPELVSLEDFNEVLAKFYSEAHLSALWTGMEPAYDPAIARLQGPLVKIVQQTTGYLREVVRSDTPRTFSVYVEPLVGANTNFRTYGDHYVVVFDGGENIPVEQIRHAFLHYLLDSLPVRYYASVKPTIPLLNIAARAPRLPREYKDDLPGFYTECLIKAVELQLNHTTVEVRAHAMDAEEADGFVLVRPLVAQLEKFQQSEPAMTFYFQDMAKAIDVPAEVKRLETVKFAPPETAAPVDPAVAIEAEKESLLQQGEHLMAAQKPAEAQPVFEQVVARWPGTPRAVFGLALCAAMQGNTDRARELFTGLTKPQSASSTSNGETEKPVVDPVVLAWSHVYLGRFSDLDDNRAAAVAEYRAALAVRGAPESARKAAQLGVDKPYPKPIPEGDH